MYRSVRAPQGSSSMRAQPAAGSVGQGQAAAEGQAQLLRDGQAEAGATGVAIARVFHPVERA